MISSFAYGSPTAQPPHFPLRRGRGALTSLPAFGAKKVGIGVELFSVRNELAKDLEGTLKEVAKIGYEGVEFFGPYFSWTPERAKEVRKLLDDLKLKCFSTHNGANVFTPENAGKAIELNSILGSKFVVMASAGRVQNLDGWKKVVENLNMGHEKFKTAKLAAGFHNHQTEWKEVEGTKPIELIANGTPKDFVLQLDVGTTVETGNDPVAWIEKNKGRLRSIHLKEYSKEPGKGYRVLFGEGSAPGKRSSRRRRNPAALSTTSSNRKAPACPRSKRSLSASPISRRRAAKLSRPPQRKERNLPAQVSLFLFQTFPFHSARRLLRYSDLLPTFA